MIVKAKDILLTLKKLNLLESKPKYWWPNVGEFEVVIGVILTQNTKWDNVEKSLKNLKEFLEFEKFLQIDINFLKDSIRTCGFYNQKAIRLYHLAHNIEKNFNNFNNFQKNVTREWLLEQKGIGFESADSILCYGCFKDILVIDSYTNKLLRQFGYEFNSYLELQEWLMQNIEQEWKSLSKLYENNLNLCYARFHGKIVEFMKNKKDISFIKHLKEKLE